MSPAAERQMLRSVLRRIDNPNRPVLASRWFMPVVWVAFVLAVVLLLAFAVFIGPWLSAACFILLGVAYMHALFKSAAAKSWPSLAPYFDRASIEERLKELEA